MAKMNDVLKTVSRKIRPTKEDRKRTERFASALQKEAEKIAKPYSVRPMLCGSISKNTWLPNKNELDMFLIFNPLVSRKKLTEDGLEIARRVIKNMGGVPQKKYAEHPYLCGTMKFEDIRYQVDVVPCYDIKNLKKIKSAVDRTPHHVRFVKGKLLLPDEARLLKQFCKANACYGADVKTSGFSGYLCELLIIAHGKFDRLIKAASKWRAPTIITLQDMDKEELRKKFKAPLILIDPVDVNRNVAAAVSPEIFYKFVDAAKSFADSPSQTFFFPKDARAYSVFEISKEIKKRGTRWYMIRFKKPDVVDDTLYPQVKRGTNSVGKILTQNGFRILRKGFWIGDECVMIFEMDVWMTPGITKNIGPNVYSKHADDFLKHYKEYKTFVEGDDWVVELSKKFTTVLHLLKDLVSSSPKALKEKGIPSKIASNFIKGQVVSGSDTLKTIKDLPEDFRLYMREWFEKDYDIV